MPVQINELVIRATVIEEDSGKKNQAVPSANADPAAKHDIVKECVAIVLEVLNLKKGR